MTLSNTRLFIIASGGCLLWLGIIMLTSGVNLQLPMLQQEMNAHPSEVQWASLTLRTG
jgi:hypothetical protein